MGLFETSSRLRVRLRWLEKKTWKYRGLRTATIVAVVAGMCVFILPMAEARRTTPSPDAERNRTSSSKPSGSGAGKTEDETSDGKPFTATLPDGITVELIGVCDSESRDKQWWRPDGSVLEAAPYRAPAAVFGDEKLSRAVAVRLAGDNLDDSVFTFEIPDTTLAASSSQTPGEGQESLNNISFTLPEDQATVDVRIGVACGEWATTLLDFDGEGTKRHRIGNSRKHDIVFHHSHQKDGSACVSVTHSTMRLATRIVAIGKTGKIRQAKGTSSRRNGDFSIDDYLFDLPLDQVSRFSLEVQPCRWILFRNVSLRPGYETDVQIETGPDQAIALSASSDAGPIGEHALSFDGVDDYLHVPARATMELKPPFTIEMWIKPDFLELRQKIDYYRSHPDQKRGLWFMWLARKFEATLDPKKPAHGGFLMGVQPSSRPEEKCYTSFFIGEKGGMVQAGLSAGKGVEWWRPRWLHVTEVCTRESYIPVPDQPLLIGEFFKGEIAEIRIWSKVTTLEDILLYAHTSLTGNEPNLVACWDFEQAGEHIVYDISPNANHARLGKWAQIDAADPNWVDL